MSPAAETVIAFDVYSGLLFGYGETARTFCKDFVYTDSLISLIGRRLVDFLPALVV